MSDKATSLEVWRGEGGFHVRLPGQQRAGKPFPSMDAGMKAAIDAGVPLPSSIIFRDPKTVPREHMPITRSKGEPT